MTHIKTQDWTGGTRSPRLSGGSPREGARSEVRAEQRLAAGGCKLPRPVVRYAFVVQSRLALEQVFVRTCVLMTVDARGGLWLDNPLLCLGLPRPIWVVTPS